LIFLLAFCLKKKNYLIMINNRFHRLVILILILLNIPMLIFALSFSEADRTISELTQTWINSKISNSLTLAKLRSLDQEISENLSGFDEYYLLAKSNLLKGTIKFSTDKQSDSIPFLEESSGQALKAVAISKDSSDAWRIAAEAGSMIMIQKGIPFIIANARRIQGYIDTSLLLNSYNSRTAVLNAQKYINAPRIFGGDVSKGIEIIENALIQTILPEDRFFALYTLVQAYDKKKDINSALENVNRVLEIFPDNPSIIELIDDL